MVVYIVIGIIILLLIMYIALTINSFINLNNMVKEAFSTMDVYLKKRWDLIPNLVETVKGYAKHEKQTLQEIVELRNSYKTYDSLSTDEKINANEKIAPGYNKLLLLAESYPQLKANENFLNLQKELTNVENEIAQSRKYYNATVRKYNNKVEMIPSNIIAKILNYKTKNMFEADKNERESIKVQL